LSLVVLASALVLLTADARRTVVPFASRDRQLAAARRMKASLEAVKALRLSLGIPIEPDLDPNSTGIIGQEFTQLTTSLGVLEAKRTSTNPAFGALLVKYFEQAGLKQGDVVAVGASGSFPALIVATLSAARTLGLVPIVIYSVGASMYGANVPGFTFIEMLRRLSAQGLIPYELAAVSPGGDGDAGRGVVFGDRNGTLMAVAEHSGVPLIREESVAASVRRRLEVFDRHRGGRPIKCFVNIGGAAPNFGTTTASLQFPHGLVVRAPVRSTGAERGLIFEFATRGVPVIHLLNVRGLALDNGLPIDPVPLPPVGEGGVYYRRTVATAPLWVAVVLSIALGVVVARWLRRT
jgi:poly-gamma-glutamate system protein